MSLCGVVSVVFVFVFVCVWCLCLGCVVVGRREREGGEEECGEGEDVVSVHTLLSGVVQVCHELLVGEEEEKEEEQGRQEEREVER